MNLKFLIIKLKQIKLNMIQIEKQLKFLHYHPKELDKYEYLTGEDLGYKSGLVEQAKFEYSPLGKIFNKGLDEKGKKEGLFKSIENKSEKH